MKEKLENFPPSVENISNREKLKVLSLYNFLISVSKIDDYLNDSVFSTIKGIDQFSEIMSYLTKSKSILLNLHSLVPENKKDSVSYFCRNLNQFFDTISIIWIKLSKRLNSFVLSQSKRISLSDRKTLLNQLSDYSGTTIKFSFKWSNFENHFQKFDKDFFPRFKKYFTDLLMLEDHWQQPINGLVPTKNLPATKKSLSKEIESFLSSTTLEDYSDNFFEKTIKILEERLELLKFSPEDKLPTDKMAKLIL